MIAGDKRVLISRLVAKANGTTPRNYAVRIGIFQTRTGMFMTLNGSDDIKQLTHHQCGVPKGVDLTTENYKQ
jgi:hypothetical protein